MAAAAGFGKQPSYVYTVSGGRIVGEGSKVAWDLSENGPGYYTATVEVQDKQKQRGVASVTVVLQNCADCSTGDCECPTLAVDCYKQVKAGTPITCIVRMSMSRTQAQKPLTYEWTVRDWNGPDVSERISGRGKSISIRTDGLGQLNLITTVEVKGIDLSCTRTASAWTLVKP